MIPSFKKFIIVKEEDLEPVIIYTGACRDCVNFDAEKKHTEPNITREMCMCSKYRMWAYPDTRTCRAFTPKREKNYECK